MDTSTRTQQSTNDKLLFLRQEQEKYHEGSKNWSYYQSLMNQIIAQNYLEYVNR